MVGQMVPICEISGGPFPCSKVGCRIAQLADSVGSLSEGGVRLGAERTPPSVGRSTSRAGSGISSTGAMGSLVIGGTEFSDRAEQSIEFDHAVQIHIVFLFVTAVSCRWIPDVSDIS